ncbi:MAG: glycerol-3-phosphate dehydrogenase C-terminal domain-containing protein, partial [Ilumatobacteraceae bacterium]
LELEHPAATRADIDYILEALNQSITTNVTRNDVTAVWSGLRPLVRQADGTAASGKTADLSRNHKVAVSPSGVVSITGGKLTTYRKMAEHTVDEVCSRLGRRSTSKSKRLTLIGGRGFERAALDGEHAHLAQRYGTELDRVLAIAAESPAFSRPLIDGLPYLGAEAIFAVRHEMALTLDDVLARRTRARIVDRRATLASARQVAELIAPELGWSQQEIDAQVRDFVESCAREEAAGVVSEAEYLASTRQD